MSIYELFKLTGCVFTNWTSFKLPALLLCVKTNCHQHLSHVIFIRMIKQHGNESSQDSCFVTV